MFIQIHTLTSYPAALLNRDDTGAAKRMNFGGTDRIRISSQCLKRHWRVFDGVGSLHAFGLPNAPEPSVRSRLTFSRFVRDPMTDSGIDVRVADLVTSEIMKIVLGESAKAKSTERSDALTTNQVTIFGRPEIKYLFDLAIRVADSVEVDDETNDKDLKKEVKEKVMEMFTREVRENLRALVCGAGLDVALFGRMVTSDVLARTDGAVHVAHAFTVHGLNVESDFFTIVDDIAQEADGNLGSAHIGTADLATGIYYGYVVVDIPLLISNLTGVSQSDWRNSPRDIANECLRRLIRIIATVSPGAKLGSTAPYSRSHLVFIEVGEEQPRTLANAFQDGVPLHGNALEKTFTALDKHVGEHDQMYGDPSTRSFAGMGPVKLLTNLGKQQSLNDLCSWVVEQVK